MYTSLCRRRGSQATGSGQHPLILGNPHITSKSISNECKWPDLRIYGCCEDLRPGGKAIEKLESATVTVGQRESARRGPPRPAVHTEWAGPPPPPSTVA